jgi:hypothetical protein
MAITILGVTTREKALKLVQELPESQLESLIDFLEAQDQPGDIIDEWGNLSAMQRASATQLIRRLDEEERAELGGTIADRWDREAHK